MNPRLRITFALTLGLLALVGTLALLMLPGIHPSAHASPSGATRYVAPTGNDSGNDCTISPCRTVQYAVDVATSSLSERIPDRPESRL